MNKLSLLLVEDNMDDEWLALRALKKLGLEQVRVARDGCETLAMLCEQGDTFVPDLILLDLKLPRMDGIQVLRKLRATAATSALNVVMLTSSEDPQALVTCRGFGVLACLQKPLTADALLPVLQALSAASHGHGLQGEAGFHAAHAGWSRATDRTDWTDRADRPDGQDCGRLRTAAAVC